MRRSAPAKLKNTTPVTNEMLAQIMRSHLRARESQVLWCIVRETWGYDAEDGRRYSAAEISLAEFSVLTGLSRTCCQEALARLRDRRIISVRNGGDRKPLTYRINTQLSDWKLSTTGGTEAKKSRRHPSVRNGVDSLSTTGGTELSATGGTELYTPGVNALIKKEINKRKIKETPPSPSMGERAFEVKKRSDEEKAAIKELSKQRNEMIKSKLYAEDEISVLKEKSLSELQTIHAEKLRTNNGIG